MNALELADKLDGTVQSLSYSEDVAAELRRLHAINIELVAALERAQNAILYAIDCGDWLVDGANDPDTMINRIENLIEKAKQ